MYFPLRDPNMRYFAEILDEHKVWLVNENRRLLSLHDSIEEACNTCHEKYQSTVCVVDRRGSQVAKV